MVQDLFLDTNIIIDYLTNRKPFSVSASRLFSLAENNKVKFSVSAISYTIIYYVLRKNNPRQNIIQSLMLLSNLCNVLPVDQMLLEQAMKSDFVDFEDAVQYYSAIQNKNCSIIISRNVKDFKQSAIKVMSPDEFLRINKLL